MCIEFRISSGYLAYGESLTQMMKIVDEVVCEKRGDLVWLLEHYSVYTSGASAVESDLISADFPVVNVDRGGKYTYHGPGQRVIYFVLNLRKYNMCDVRKFISSIERVLLSVLAKFGIIGKAGLNGPGVWVGSHKIAFIGIKIRKWVSCYGAAINIDNDLSHFNGIVPCGDNSRQVISMKELGVKVSVTDVDKEIFRSFIDVFCCV